MMMMMMIIIIIIIIIIMRRRSAREIEYTTDWMIFQVVFIASITTKNGILHIPTSRNRTGSDPANSDATVQCLLFLPELSLSQQRTEWFVACAVALFLKP